MRPTDVLSNEHRIIEQVLACLKKIVAQCAADGKLDRAPAEQALDFFQTFTERWHHGKEEEHLFPALEPKGFARDFGPTHFMRLEHEEGGGYLRQMGAAIPGAAAGEVGDVRRFTDNARH